MASHVSNLLKSVGKTVFLTYFDTWKSSDIHAKIKAGTAYSENAIKTRVIKARRILETPAGIKEALEIIAASKTTEPATVAAAKARLAAAK